MRWWTALDPLKADQSVTIIVSVVTALFYLVSTTAVLIIPCVAEACEATAISRLVWRQRLRCSCLRPRKSKIPEDEEGDPGAQVQEAQCLTHPLLALYRVLKEVKVL